MENSLAEEEKQREQWLATYLADHSAGAQHAAELLRALSEHHAETPIGRFATDLLQEIDADLRVLESLAQSTGASGFRLKELGGWVADKLGRLKLAPLNSAFNTFEALEFLSIGILGKRSLWRTLSSVAHLHTELQGPDFTVLIERAENQYSDTEKMRLQMAEQVFG